MSGSNGAAPVRPPPPGGLAGALVVALLLVGVALGALELVAAFVARPLLAGVSPLDALKLGAAARGPDLFDTIDRVAAGAGGAEVVYPTTLRDPDLFSLGGQSGVLAVTDNMNGFWAVTRHDEHGFPNPPGSWSRPADYVFMGRSTVYGWAVDEKQAFVAQLRDQLPGGVMNLSYIQLNPEFYIPVIREYLDDRHPRYVVFTLWDRRAPIPATEARYADPKARQHLMDRQAEIDTRERAHFQQLRSDPALRASVARGHAANVGGATALGDLLRLRNLRALPGDIRKLSDSEAEGGLHHLGDCTPAMADSVRAYLAAMDAEIRRVGAAPVLLYLPTRAWLSDPRPGRGCHAEIVDEARAAGMAVVDLPTEIMARKPGISLDTLFPIGDNAHLTLAGNTLVADILAETLPR